MKKNGYLKYVLHAAILIGVVVAGVRYLNGEEVLNALASFNYAFAPFILLISLVFFVIKAWRFVILVRPVSDLPWGVVFRAYMAGQAATMIPGGVAARAGLMNQVGVSVARSSGPIILSSALDQAVFIVGSLIAALWFEYARLPALILLGILVVVSPIFLIPASRRWLAGVAEWAAGKFNVQEQWHNFLDCVPEVATRRILLITFGMTVVAFFLRVVALDLSLRGLGMSLSYPALFLAVVLPTMLGRLVPIPGGIGVTEAGMVGFLVSTWQLDAEKTAAAVAIFRIGTIFFEALLGALVYFFAWHGEEEVATSPSSS